MFSKILQFNYPYNCTLIHHLIAIQLDYLTSEPSIRIINSSLKEIGSNAFE